jgi:branched-chain amino acid transport system ATP-binding protein
MGIMMLALEGVSRRFGGLSVIDAVDLAVAEGDVLGILGPNGAGKSTLLNLIGGVLAPSAGRILYDDRDITRMRVWDRSRIGIGRTYQIPKPFAHMSVFENLLVAAVHGGGMSIAHAKQEVAATLALTGLDHRAALPAGRLSLLDLKRLELAKALALEPRLLLLDEIAGGLTEAECDGLLMIVRQVHAKGTTVIWIEHVIQALRRIATRLAVLSAGAILAQGAPDAVLADSRVKAVYLGT